METFRSTTWLLGLVLVAPLIASGCSTGSGASGADGREITLRGSDTLSPLATKWAESYKDADIAASGGGTGVGIKALIDGQVDIATASDEMNAEQREEAKTKTGKDPVEYTVAKDALAIYVHKDNPIKSISLDQLAEIYGDGGMIEKWSDLDPSLPNETITRVGRQNSSGTYKYFHEKVVGKKRRYKDGTLERNGSADVVRTVGATPGAIGYSGMAFVDPGVKKIPVSKKNGETPVEATIDHALDGSYPLARALYLYTLGKPEGAIKKFVDWTLSPPGQLCVQDAQFVPIGPVK
jgi:phosphate transport system substrate-binding protein